MLRGSPGAAARLPRRRRRRVLRRRPERARRWPTPSATTARCTTARPSRGTCATSTCSTRLGAVLDHRGPDSQDRRLGAQLARRRRRGHGDGRARRAQRRPALPAGVRRPRVHRRLRHRSRHGRGGQRLGRADGGDGRASRARRELRAALPRRRRSQRSCSRCAIRDAACSSSELRDPRLERAIGVVYRPETELASHYFQAVLPAQFDEYVWFDETRAVTPLAPTAQLTGER